MRIGTLTFHLGPNHGGYLQAYCLVEALKKMGHDAEIINYKNPRHHEIEKFKPWVYRRPFKLYQAWIKHQVFKNAFEKLPMSEFSTDVRKIDWDQYDAVIVGSDVVWDFKRPSLGQDSVYFGNFGKPYAGRLISYAPSTGSVPVDATIPNWVSAGLKGFHAISARDETTRSIVKHACGRDAEMVVDPTWLDLQYQERPGKQEPYMVVYAFHLDGPFKEAIVQYARKRGLKIVALGYYHGWADRNLMNIGPLDFEAHIRNATACVAGTFHGALYAIKSQSRFVTVLNERILSRVTRALSLAGLEDRGITNPDSLEPLLEQHIDYGAVFHTLRPHIEQSLDFLRRNIG